MISWVSTRAKTKDTASLAETVLKGLAPDGGLFVPTAFPKAAAIKVDPKAPFHVSAAAVLAPFFEGSPLLSHLPQMCEAAFTFPVELKRLDETTQMLELFHGPTAAFKDFGARFLAQLMARLTKRVTVLVATSGDTGGAVASAFYKLNGAQVVVLFPKDRISGRQRKQLTAWGDNILSLEVSGDFDACQKLVKEAFLDKELRDKLALSSANSINVGRLLPQLAYFAVMSVRAQAENGKVPNFIIPSGNLGDAVGAVWAKQMGFPIGQIAIVTNQNATLSEYFQTGTYKARPSVVTLANAMDVGSPSNFERLAHLYPKVEQLKAAGITVHKVSDPEIVDSIRVAFKRWNLAICPHTATAARVHFNRKPFPEAILVATAHPAKFEMIVEPEIGKKIPIPAKLDEILQKNSIVEPIAADFKAFKTRILRLS